MWNYRLCPPTLRPPRDTRDIWSAMTAAMAVCESSESCTAAPAQLQGDTCPGAQSDIIQGDRMNQLSWSAVSRWHRVTLYTAACLMCCSQQDCHSFNWIHLKTSSWVDGYNLHNNIIFYVRYLPCLRFLVKNFSENCKMPKFHGASAWPEMDSGHSGAAP